MKFIIIISVVCIVILIGVAYSISSPQNEQKGTVLSYYVEDIPYSYEPATKRIIANATSAWEKNNPTLKFKQVDDKEDSDIEIDWTNFILKDRMGETTIMETSLWGFSTYHYLVKIDIVNADCNNNEIRWDENAITTTLTHEFGHVLGLEHSSDDNNLMYDPDDGIENMPTKGYVLPERITHEDYFVGEKELIDQIQLEENKIISQDNELDEYNNKIERLISQHGYTIEDLNNNRIESYDGKFIDELNALVEKYNALLLEANPIKEKYNLLIDKYNCFVDYTNPEHIVPKAPKFTIVKPQLSYKICQNDVCTPYVPNP